MSEVSPPPTLDEPAAQPTVPWMPLLVATSGVFPYDGAPQPAYTQGMIHCFGAWFEAFGAPSASGQVIPIVTNPSLFSQFGSVYGGDERTTFAYPELDNVVAVGGERGQTGAGTLALTWLIATQSVWTAPFAGMLALNGGHVVPGGWLVADGSVVQIGAYPQLFAAIGDVFGGDGQTNFALPNLTGAAPVGTGLSGSSLIMMGETIPGPIPGLGLDYLICSEGVLPPGQGDGSFDMNTPFLGQIVAYAGNTIPQGWQACDGSSLSVAIYNGLYLVIGSRYGGDGINTFATPNLSGLMVLGRPV